MFKSRASESNLVGMHELSELVDSGEKYHLEKEEKVELLKFEDDLGERLESIFNISSPSFSAELSYLESEVGRADFEKTFAVPLPELDTRDDVRVFLHTHSEIIKNTKLKTRADFTGRSVSFLDEENRRRVLEIFNKSGSVSFVEVESPESMSIKLSPEQSLQKISQLRGIKQYVKSEIALLEGESGANEAKLDLLQIYARRINELIAGFMKGQKSILEKQSLGLELEPAEQALLSQFREYGIGDKTTSRYDKFIYGVDVSSETSGGNYDQVADYLLRYAEEKSVAYIDSVAKRRGQAADKGLDIDKLENTETYQPMQIRAFAEEVLQRYGVLSSESPGEYNPTLDKPAADGGWRVVIGDAYKTMSVVSSQKVVKIPNKPMSAARLFSVCLAHEIEGHVLQAINNTQVPLRLMSRVKADSSDLFAEAGAKTNENFWMHSAFGYDAVAAPHYVRSMATRLQGGDYTACLQTFYNSAIEPYTQLMNQGEISAEEYKGYAAAVLDRALRSVSRLFRNNAEATSVAGFLTNSKDTVYLEQVRLAEQLAAAGMSKYLYLSGVNADVLKFLYKADMLDDTRIATPQLYSLELWEREKEKFAL